MRWEEWKYYYWKTNENLINVHFNHTFTETTLYIYIIGMTLKHDIAYILVVFFFFMYANECNVTAREKIHAWIRLQRWTDMVCFHFKRKPTSTRSQSVSLRFGSGGDGGGGGGEVDIVLLHERPVCAGCVFYYSYYLISNHSVQTGIWSAIRVDQDRKTIR